MIEPKKFDYIKEKHGLYSSWAIWADAGLKPKSNISDMSILDPNKNKLLLKQINPSVIMVGLNFSRNIEKLPFINFHDKNIHGQDYKIRYAFINTMYYGAYMTDIIKFHEEVDSKNVMKSIKNDQSIITENLKTFREEISDLNTIEKPIIIAFGKVVYDILLKYLERNEYDKLI